MPGQKFYDIISPEELERRKREFERDKKLDKSNSGFALSRNPVVKIITVLLIITLNRTGLSAVMETFGYFNNTEVSEGNIYVASTLDFIIPPVPDFNPEVTPTQDTFRTIELDNEGDLDFVYSLHVENATGTLCDYLNLGDDLTTGTQPLISYVSDTTTFSSKSIWNFTAQLTDDNFNLQGKICTFDFIFDGDQIEFSGFNDEEGISNIILSGHWEKIVINKVYYDPDCKHGKEPKNEWIELYNPGEQEVSLKKWEICNYDDCEILDPQKTIPGFGFVLLSHDNSTWKYWEVPDYIEKIHQLGGHFNMDNDADMLLLKDSYGNIVDQMNWGIPTSTWPNWNEDIWDPGVPGVAEGHLLARVPTGYDTDQPSDWKDLGLPEVEVIWPNGGEVLWVGRTYTLQWLAVNPNGSDTELSIAIYYSADSGHTWAQIVEATENDGEFEWRVPLCIDGYYTPSNRARIKVVATGPENPMVQDWDMSDHDFCPPIDFDLLLPEEIQFLIDLGLIDYFVRGGDAVAINEEHVEESVVIIEEVIEEITSSTETFPAVESPNNENSTNIEIINEDSSTEELIIGEQNSTSEEFIVEDNQENESSTPETLNSSFEEQNNEYSASSEEEETPSVVLPDEDNIEEQSPAVLPPDDGNNNGSDLTGGADADSGDGLE